MRRNSFPTTALAWFSLASSLLIASSSSALELGAEITAAALRSELVDLDGVSRPLSEHWGEKGALLVFTANTCPYALDWADRFPTLAAEARSQGLAFLMINANARKRRDTDSPEAMTLFLEERSWELPYLVDPDSRLAGLLGATRTPEVFLFDAARRLAYHGAIDDQSGPVARVSEHFAMDALRLLALGESVLRPTTQPIGCAILKPRRPRGQPH